MAAAMMAAGTSSSSSPGRKLRLGPTGLTEKEQVHGLERYFTEREKFFTDRELELSTQIASLLAENGNLCKQLDGAKEKLKNVEAREVLFTRGFWSCGRYYLSATLIIILLPLLRRCKCN